MVSPSELERYALRVEAELGFCPPRESLERWVGELTTLEHTHVGLGLACGLFLNQPQAHQYFGRIVAPKVRAALRRAGAESTETDELLHAALIRLLVEDDAKRLRSYRGQGSFTAFVSTVALRLLSDNKSAVVREDSDEQLERLPQLLDLERHLARAQNRAFFTAAFRAALASLEPRQKALLTLNLVNGSSIDDLAPLYDISRATAARWLASAKETLRTETLRRLAESTGQDSVEVQQLLTSLQSGFDVSLRRFLTDEGGAAPVPPSPIKGPR